MERAEIDWPHVFMPCGTRSPTAVRWGIDEWPTIFVLDDLGVIRHRGNEDALGGEELGDAVRALLAEMEGAGGG